MTSELALIRAAIVSGSATPQIESLCDRHYAEYCAAGKLADQTLHPRAWQPKSCRRWGAIWNFIRDEAKRHGRRSFTYAVFCPPLSAEVAKRNLNRLARLGELEIVRMGLRGKRASRPTLYRVGQANGGKRMGI